MNTLIAFFQETYSDDYNTCVEEAKRDLKENARPELVSVPESYDALILGYPKMEYAI